MGLTLQDPKAARMALYAADAETLFDTVKTGAASTGVPALPSAAAAPFALLAAADWDIAGQIRCDDDLTVLQTLKRRFKLRQDNYFYGFLLRRKTVDPTDDFAIGDYLAMVRGTMEPEEWLLDAIVTPDLFNSQGHPRAGTVPAGFYSIYDSMTLVDGAGRNLGDAATAIGNIVNGENNKLTVVGHSLGAALVSYLTFDLAAAVHDPAGHLDAHMIACPNPGDTAFTKGFRDAVPNYGVVNWERDLVPKLPPLPYGPLLNGGPAQNVLLLTETTPNIGTLPVDNPQCNHHAVGYARMLDNGNPIAAAQALACGC